MQQSSGYTATPWPLIRSAIETGLNLHRKHTIGGMVEADVTAAINRIEALRRDHGIVTSLHIYAIYCLSRTLVEHPGLNSYRHRKQIITFDDVDIGTTAERRMPGGVRYAAGIVVRGVQKMSLAELNQHMRARLRSDPAQDPSAAKRRAFAKMPGLLRRWIVWRMKNNPFLFKDAYGTVGLTSLNMAAANQPYFVIPPNFYTMTVATGGINDRYVLQADGRAGKRTFMPVTVMVDHAMVDGAVGTRVAKAFVDRLQQAGDLGEDFVRACPKSLEKS